MTRIHHPQCWLSFHHSKRLQPGKAPGLLTSAERHHLDSLAFKRLLDDGATIAGQADPLLPGVLGAVELAAVAADEALEGLLGDVGVGELAAGDGLVEGGEEVLDGVGLGEDAGGGLGGPRLRGDGVRGGVGAEEELAVAVDYGVEEGFAVGGELVGFVSFCFFFGRR